MKNPLTSPQSLTTWGKWNSSDSLRMAKQRLLLPVHEYQQKIHNFIYWRVRDREIAKDLCQVVFLKARQAFPSFRGKLYFTTGSIKLLLIVRLMDIVFAQQYICLFIRLFRPIFPLSCPNFSSCKLMSRELRTPILWLFALIYVSLVEFML